MRETEPYKVALFLTRDPAVPAAMFTDRWLDPGGPPVPAGLRGHFHNAPARAEVPIENAPPAPFDGVDEYLFDSAAQAEAFFGSDLFREEWLEPRASLLGPGIAALSGPAHRVWQRPGPPSPGAVKILTLPVRRPGMTMAEFADYWIGHHAGLALASPGVRERLQGLVSSPADEHRLAMFEAAPFDGIGNIFFASPQSLEAEFAGRHYREVMAPDEPRFTDPANSRAMMVSEIVIHSAS